MSCPQVPLCEGIVLKKCCPLPVVIVDGDDDAGSPTAAASSSALASARGAASSGRGLKNFGKKYGKGVVVAEEVEEEEEVVVFEPLVCEVRRRGEGGRWRRGGKGGWQGLLGREAGREGGWRPCLPGSSAPRSRRHLLSAAPLSRPQATGAFPSHCRLHSQLACTAPPALPLRLLLPLLPVCR